MLDADRPEDIANRRFYNHLPTKHVTVTYECDVACDPSDASDAYVRSLLLTDGMTGNLRVRNPVFMSAAIGDEIRYLDTLGRETTP
jgi:hypothetical protein